MTNTIKFSALTAVAFLAGCSCLKSPDLNVGTAAEGSKYGSSEYSNGSSTAAAPNSGDVRSKFDSEIVAGGFNQVLFDYDSAAITSAAQANLDKFVAFSKANDVKGVTVEGHADERGTREYNLALGDRRAVAIKRYLVGAGVDAGKMTTISYGKERPAVEGHDESAWTKNRRGVLVLQ
jgi:peptidoglycan-associated lipoprotein